MIRARRLFLEGGHYEPMADAIAIAVAAGLDAAPARTDLECLQLLDAGCGEGYVLGRIMRHLSCNRCGENLSVCAHGIDLCKMAVRLASRQHGHTAFFTVASSYQLPFEDKSVDAVVSVFAPCPALEFSRVLRSGGTLVVASPGAGHLSQLRRRMHVDSMPLPPREQTDPDMTGLPMPKETCQVAYALHLPGHEAAALLAMTPYHWKATPLQRSAIAAETCISLDVDIIITRYRMT